MAVIVGGLRARLIYDSIYNCLHDSLEDLGWFDAGRRHRAITFDGRPVPQDTEIPLNTIVLTDEDLFEQEAEMGSTLTETQWTFYVDFYAENDVIGKQLINDVRDILAGRMSTIGRAHPSVVVYDYQQATPPAIFKVGVEDIVVDRAHDFPKPWQRHWYACRFTVVDAYGDETSDREYDDFTYDSGPYG